MVASSSFCSPIIPSSVFVILPSFVRYPQKLGQGHFISHRSLSHLARLFVLPSFLLPFCNLPLSLQVGGHHFGVLSHSYGPDAVIVKVPVRCVGTLMGSRGIKIKEIKEKTGARITFSKVRRKGESSEGVTKLCCLCLGGLPCPSFFQQVICEERPYFGK